MRPPRHAAGRARPPARQGYTLVALVILAAVMSIATAIVLPLWSSDEQHAALQEELKEFVNKAWKEAVTYGTMTEGPKLDVRVMFDDVYAEIPPHLESQRQQLLALRGLSE